MKKKIPERKSGPAWISWPLVEAKSSPVLKSAHSWMRVSFPKGGDSIDRRGRAVLSRHEPGGGVRTPNRATGQLARAGGGRGGEGAAWTTREERV